jgi:2-polyprenyl-6-methoxyphenol hydroxylase-like FAD-dependent oxidoreductase
MPPPKKKHSSADPQHCIFRVSRLLEHATTCHRTVQYIPEMLRLADSSTRIVIIGDAAHAIPVRCAPGTRQSSAELAKRRHRYIVPIIRALSEAH